MMENLKKCSDIRRSLPSGVSPVKMFTKLYIKREKLKGNLAENKKEYDKYMDIAIGRCLVDFPVPHEPHEFASVLGMGHNYVELERIISNSNFQNLILNRQWDIDAHMESQTLQFWEEMDDYEWNDVWDEKPSFQEWKDYFEEKIKDAREQIEGHRLRLNTLNDYKEEKYTTLPHVHRMFLEAEMEGWTEGPSITLAKMTKLCEMIEPNDLPEDPTDIDSIRDDFEQVDENIRKGYLELGQYMYDELKGSENREQMAANLKWMTDTKKNPDRTLGFAYALIIFTLAGWPDGAVNYTDTYRFLRDIFEEKEIHLEKAQHIVQWSSGGKKTTRPMVVITTPHSYCRPDKIPRRHCDRMAGPASDALNMYFDLLNIPYREFESLDLRSRGDMNRKLSRSSVYRRNITKFMKTHKESVKLNLDVHSYPKGHPRGDKGDIYIINYYGKTTPYERSFIDWLDKTLGREYKIRTGPYNHDDKTNDIQDEMRRDHEVDSILIEFREVLAPKQLERVCVMITLWAYNRYVSKAFKFVAPNRIVVREGHEDFLPLTEKLAGLGFKVDWLGVKPQKKSNAIERDELVHVTRGLKGNLTVSFMDQVDTKARNFGFKVGQVWYF